MRKIIIFFMLLLNFSVFAKELNLESFTESSGYSIFNKVIIINESKIGFSANNNRIEPKSETEISTDEIHINISNIFNVRVYYDFDHIEKTVIIHVCNLKEDDN